MAKYIFKIMFWCSCGPFSVQLLFLDPLCPLVVVIHAGSPSVCQNTDPSSFLLFFLGGGAGGGLVANGVAGRHVWWVVQEVSKDCVCVAQKNAFFFTMLCAGTWCQAWQFKLLPLDVPQTPQVTQFSLLAIYKQIKLELPISHVALWENELPTPGQSAERHLGVPEKRTLNRKSHEFKWSLVFFYCCMLILCITIFIARWDHNVFWSVIRCLSERFFLKRKKKVHKHSKML